MNRHKDLTKQHLGIEETYILASNLNRIEDARKLQKVHTDIDSIFGILGGIAILFLAIIGIIELFKCAGNIFELMVSLLFVGIGIVVDLWYIRANWKLLIGKF